MEHFTKLVLVASIFGIAIGNVSLGAELKVPGLGATACEEITKISSTTDRNNIERREIEQWGQGYLMFESAQLLSAKYRSLLRSVRTGMSIRVAEQALSSAISDSNSRISFDSSASDGQSTCLEQKN